MRIFVAGSSGFVGKAVIETVVQIEDVKIVAGYVTLFCQCSNVQAVGVECVSQFQKWSIVLAGVGWEVYDRKCGELAAQLLQRSVMLEQCFEKLLSLHSGNGHL